MINFGIIGTLASIIAGGAVATVTVVGLVTNTVDKGPSHPASVSSSSVIEYGAR